MSNENADAMFSRMVCKFDIVHLLFSWPSVNTIQPEEKYCWDKYNISHLLFTSWLHHIIEMVYLESALSSRQYESSV